MFKNSGKKENKNKNKKERGRLHRCQATTALTLSRNFSLPLILFFFCLFCFRLLHPLWNHTTIHTHAYQHPPIRRKRTIFVLLTPLHIFTHTYTHTTERFVVFL